ncbi:MAG: InlB B-repeat-containing protein, partial [Prevotella sp.]|nr:InlB B-repeat-containing protein [Prevotella sp.]
SAGLGGAAVNGDKWRDGSKAYYLLGHDVARVAKDESVTEGKILGAFIFAATEYERLYQNNTVLFEKDLAHTYDLKAGDEITCPASGSGANITYQWYKDGVAVEGETNATIAPTASGAYYCKATSGTTTIQSSTTNVTVPGVDTETPVFTTDLAATATATVGTAKTLTVAASHADGYQWYSNTTASNTGGTEIENATSASYTFTPSAAGTLYYYCVATNSNATGTQSVASAVCTVTVNEAPAETTYTVTFNATTNGGTCATASLTQASSGASITLPTATKSGYTFNGWYTASTGGTLKGAANASYTPTANETLYAQFTENSGTGGEGDCTIKIGNSNVNSYAATFTSSSTNASVTASATAFTMGSGTTSSNSSYSSATAPYSIKYKPSSDINTSEYSDNYSISAPFTVASGYTFAPSSISATIVTEAAGYTYQAILTDGTTTYTSNDVSSSQDGVSTFSFPSLSGTALSGTVTFKIRFKSTANNKKYFVVNLPITISGEVASSSTPTPTTYTVSYNMNGHGDAIASVEGMTALPSTLPTPTATGWKFGGWYTDSGLTTAATAGASISDNTTLYAKWTEKAAATVSISPTSGNVTVGSTLDISSYVTAGSSTGAISYSTGDASKATVTNAGVITGVAEGETTIIVTQAETEEYTAGSATFTITVNAVPVTNYSVTFYNGSQYGIQTIEEGATVEAPAQSPTKEGYTFKGWALENGSTARVLFPYEVWSDVNFYAVWSEDSVGGSGEDVEIYSATATAGLNVPAYTTSGMEITSDNATIKGGKLYVYNGQNSGKNLITNEKGSTYAFLMTNSDTFFKVSLDKALAVGDKIKADIYGPKINNNNEEQPRGLWLTTASSRPKSAPTATLSVTNTSTSSDAWMASSDYIVTTDDGICGETTFYIYRATANSTYFTNFTIIREGQVIGD